MQSSLTATQEPCTSGGDEARRPKCYFLCLHQGYQLAIASRETRHLVSFVLRSLRADRSSGFGMLLEMTRAERARQLSW